MTDNPYSAPKSQISSADHLAKWLKIRKIWAWIAISSLITGNLSGLILKSRFEEVKSKNPQELSETIASVVIPPGIVIIISIIAILISLIGLLIAIFRVSKLRNSPSL